MALLCQAARSLTRCVSKLWQAIMARPVGSPLIRDRRARWGCTLSARLSTAHEVTDRDIKDFGNCFEFANTKGHFAAKTPPQCRL